MRRWMYVAVLLLVGLGAHAQDACSSDAEVVEAHLKAAPTCSKAAAMMKTCSWGSGVDSGFADIVLSKCEPLFARQLSPTATKRYRQELGLCGKQVALQDGTMYISFAAVCRVDVAEAYATNPARRLDVPLRASFDCGKAASPLERAICADAELGEDDVILSRVYQRALDGFKAKPVAATLRNDQRAWLAKLPGTCGLSEPFTPSSMMCLRKAMQVRYSLVDSCADGDEKTPRSLVRCLHETSGLRGFGGNPE